MDYRSLLARAQLGAARSTQQAADALRRAAIATDAREGVSAVLEAAGHGLGACARLAAYHAIAVVTGERIDVAPPPAAVVHIEQRLDERHREDIRAVGGHATPRTRVAPDLSQQRLMDEVRRHIADETLRDPKVARGLSLVGVDGARWACAHQFCPPRDGSPACANCPRRSS